MNIVEVQKSNFDLFNQRRFFISTNDKSYNVQNDRVDDNSVTMTTEFGDKNHRYGVRPYMLSTHRLSSSMNT